MPTQIYAKWIAPAILFVFLCVCLGYWTHRGSHPTATPTTGTAAQK